MTTQTIVRTKQITLVGIDDPGDDVFFIKNNSIFARERGRNYVSSYKGSRNSIYGKNAGENLKNVNDNVMMGYKAGYGTNVNSSITAFGSDNTFIGSYAGHDNISGYRNVYIGAKNSYDNNTNNSKENISIGYKSYANGNNSVSIGVKTSVSSNYSVAIGDTNRNDGTDSHVYGNNITNTGSNCLLIIPNSDNQSIQYLNESNNYVNIYNLLYGSLDDGINANASFNFMSNVNVDNGVLTAHTLSSSNASIGNVSINYLNASNIIGDNLNIDSLVVNGESVFNDNVTLSNSVLIASNIQSEIIITSNIQVVSDAIFEGDVFIDNNGSLITSNINTSNLSVENIELNGSNIETIINNITDDLLNTNITSNLNTGYRVLSNIEYVERPQTYSVSWPPTTNSIEIYANSTVSFISNGGNTLVDGNVSDIMNATPYVILRGVTSWTHNIEFPKHGVYYFYSLESPDTVNITITVLPLSSYVNDYSLMVTPTYVNIDSDTNIRNMLYVSASNVNIVEDMNISGNVHITGTLAVGSVTIQAYELRSQVIEMGRYNLQDYTSFETGIHIPDSAMITPHENIFTNPTYFLDDVYFSSNLHIDPYFRIRVIALEGMTIEHGGMTIAGPIFGDPATNEVLIKDDAQIAGNATINGNIYLNGDEFRFVDNETDGWWRIYTEPIEYKTADLMFASRNKIAAGFSDTFDPTILDFTGQHRCTSTIDYNIEENIGKIVVSTGKYNDLYDNDVITINEAIPVIEISCMEDDARVFGVISNKETDEKTTRRFQIGSLVMDIENPTKKTKLIINSVGEGGIWVCNINGNLTNGDLISSSSISGYGKKQDDSIIRNYTVAKITCNCEFDLESKIYNCKEIIIEDKIYRIAFVGCIYKC